jgi:hypothetical protein
VPLTVGHCGPELCNRVLEGLRITWADRTSHKGWLRAGEAMDFTASVLAEVATRLARGGQRPGAYTPAAAFGPGLASAAGGEFVID